MPRDGSGSNGRSKSYEALVKSLFTNISHPKESPNEPEAPSRPQSRIGFRKNKSPKTRHRPHHDKVVSQVEDTVGTPPSADSDEDTPDSETSDEWSTDSDTSDTTFPNDLRPYYPVPLTPPPILVPDAFPDQESPSLALPKDPCMHPPNPLRPMFPNHGLSRSALQHQKWLWNTRYDEWMQWRAEVETAEAEMGAYSGISNPALIEPPSLRRSRVSSPIISESEFAPAGKKTEINEKLFPRTGDLTALHDPQVARLDQTFCNYPLWTIQKVLFVCNMDTAARERALYAKDSEKVDQHSDDQPSGTPSSTDKYCDAEEEKHAPVPHDLSKSESTVPLLTRLSWEQSWQTRWEVLTALVRMTERAVLAGSPATIPATVTTPIGLPVVARSLADVIETSTTRVPVRFFFAGPEELGEGDGAESDDDEEEYDYGEVIVNPRFGLKKAMMDRRGFGRDFLHRQMLPVDARSGVKALRS
ncbi:hypothetical protein B0F90DRAFT_1731448 [Multifurca ochricompacta]|uniref:Uncharacterized protein n=1 Tax=Multifurca ochricompacta TaxID=376703 RepID=A0AAD4M265_9AGAM|nr:hypothetical protein B0F90DRAFT_1731448 [Multifurca ochricompacta]